MKEIIKAILDSFIILLYQYKLRTGIITYFYFLKNLYIFIWISSFLFFLLFLVFAIYWTYYYNSQIFLIYSFQYLIFYIYKFLILINLSLLFFHIYFSLKHILLDYVRNINAKLTNIYFLLIILFIFLLIYLSYFKIIALNISYLYLFLKNIYLILFIFFFNLFFINSSVLLLLRNKLQVIKINFISYFLIIFFILILLSFMLHKIIYLDFNSHIYLNNNIITNIGMLRSWCIYFNDVFFSIIPNIFFNIFCNTLNILSICLVCKMSKYFWLYKILLVKFLILFYDPISFLANIYLKIKYIVINLSN